MINELSVQDEHTPVESKVKVCSFTGTNFSSHSNLDYNLGQNKMEQQANRLLPTPPKKVEDEAAQKPKCAIFLSLIGGGEYKFPIPSVQDILSVIVAGLWILHCIVLGFSLCG